MWEVLWPSNCLRCDRTCDRLLCGSCGPQGSYRPDLPIPLVQGVITTAVFPSPVGDALKIAKYGRNRPLAVELARRFAESLAPVLRRSPFEAVVPVPSHWRTRLHRGFEISALLARELGRAVQRPVWHVLQALPSEHQAGTAGSLRSAAARSRFRAARPLRGRVLLVDDVTTTGATAAACAQELLGSGVEAVWLATLCAARRTETFVQIL